VLRQGRPPISVVANQEHVVGPNRRRWDPKDPFQGRCQPGVQFLPQPIAVRLGKTVRHHVQVRRGVQLVAEFLPAPGFVEVAPHLVLQKRVAPPVAAGRSAAIAIAVATATATAVVVVVGVVVIVSQKSLGRFVIVSRDAFRHFDQNVAFAPCKEGGFEDRSARVVVVGGRHKEDVHEVHQATDEAAQICRSVNDFFGLVDGGCIGIRLS